MKYGQRLIAEFLGTFALTFFGAGAIITAAFLRAGQLGSTATGPRVLAFTGPVDLIFIALAHGIVLGVMITSLAHISGGHFNPVVTIGAFVGRHIEAPVAALYILSQFAAGLAAAGALRFIFPGDLPAVVKWGAPVAALDVGKSMVVEALLTFFLVLVVYAVAIDPRAAFKQVAGLAIGFVLIFDILVGGPLTGAAMNPARAFGPSVVAGIVNSDHFFIYWIGPLVGALLAAVLYQNVLMRDEPAGPVIPPGEEVAEG